jgi:hypothetical protein
VNAGPDRSSCELEAAVLKALRDRADVTHDGTSLAPQNIISRNVDRVAVGSTKVTITFKPTVDSAASTVAIPWSIPGKHECLSIEEVNDETARAPNPQLAQAIVRAHAWVKLLSDGTHISVEYLAQSVGIHPKFVRNRIRMSFLAPTITKAILEGEQPANFRLNYFIGAVPLSWSEQRLAFGSE